MVAVKDSRHISATEARIHFGQFIDEIRNSPQPIFVEKAGEPVMVLISPAEYHRLAAQDADVWERISRIRASVSARTDGKGIDDADQLIDDGRE
jgi:prevent-host-death family protein